MIDGNKIELETSADVGIVALARAVNANKFIYDTDYQISINSKYIISFQIKEI